MSWEVVVLILGIFWAVVSVIALAVFYAMWGDKKYGD